jgi:uncharacterized protein
MNIDTLRQQIIEQFQDKWALNDKAHQAGHFEEVFQTGMVINDKLGLGYDPKLILFAAYFHDLFAWSRYNHHLMSCQWISSTDHPLLVDNLNPVETRMVSWACYQHRASYDGVFENTFCELINAADRGLPGNVPAMLERAIQFRQAKAPNESAEQVLEASIKHLKEKFGQGGYARYPELYTKCFGSELELQRQHIAAL